MKETMEDVVYRLLAHINDTAYLCGHPLAGVVSAEGERRGEALRQVLVELVERLKPPVGTAPEDPAWRPYRALYLRYLEQRSPYQVQEELGLSERQVRREQSRGIAAVARLLEGMLTASSHAQRELQHGGEGALHQAMRAFEPRPEELDVARLLDELAETVKPLLVSYGVSLCLPPADGSAIYADRITLRQVLLHILSTTAALAAGGTISVGLNPEGQNIRLSFAARPVSVEKNQLLPEDAVRECNALADMSFGSVEQEMDGDGIVVHCLLPMRKPLLLLLVDDEPAAQRLLRRCLQGCGVRVTAATAAEKAMDEAIRLQPDVIVLDVLMPRQDGWEVLQQLRAVPETQSIPIVVCSVWREPELALALGASDFIRKPVTRSRLLEALRKVLPSESADRFPAMPS